MTTQYKTAPQTFRGEEGEVDRNDDYAEWYTKVRSLRKDPTVGLARAILAAPVIKTPWRVEGSSDKHVELLQKTLLPMQSVLMRDAVIGCIDYGWHAWECRRLKVDGVNYLRAKQLRHEFTIPIIDNKGQLIAAKNESSYDDRSMEITLKFPNVSFVSGNEEYGDIIGEPLMKKVEKVQDSYDSVEKAAQRHSHKIAGSHWILYFPVGESEIKSGEVKQNADIAEDILQNIESSGTISFPVAESQLNQILGGHSDSTDWKKSGWCLERLEARNSSDPFLERQKYYDALKLRALFVPERTALEGQFGTKAESSEHADMALLAIEQWGSGIMNWVNGEYSFVSSLFKMNGLQWYPGAAKVVQLPLADDDKSFMREILRTVINGDASYSEVVDFVALGDRVNVPVAKEATQIIKKISERKENAGNIPEPSPGEELED